MPSRLWLCNLVTFFAFPLVVLLHLYLDVIIIKIIIIRSLLLQDATELLALGSRPFYVACKNVKSH